MLRQLAWNEADCCITSTQSIEPGLYTIQALDHLILLESVP